MKKGKYLIFQVHIQGESRTIADIEFMNIL